MSSKSDHPTAGLFVTPALREPAIPLLARSTPLFGRGEEMAAAFRLLEDTATRLVTLTGRAGVGKTRLALEVAARLASEKGRRVRYVPLGSVPGADLVLSELASALDVEGLTSGPLVAVTHRLAMGDEVLLLDGFEHVLEAARDVRQLLERCPGLQLLVTSALPLRLSVERVVHLEGLAVADPAGLELGALAAQPAVALYCTRACAVDHRFRLDEHNALDVVALCQGVGGFPLAIELAAARSRTLSAGALLRRDPKDMLAVLHAKVQDAPARHQSLRAAIKADVELLGQHERRLLLRLAVVEGSFDTEDVEALSQDLPASGLDGLGTLVDVGLVDPSRASPHRFEMPPAVVEFSREELRSSGDLAEAESRWIGWMARRARAAAVALDEPGADVTWEWIETAEPALERASSSCVESGRTGEALDLLTALCRYWANGTPAPSHRHLVAQAVGLARVKDVCTREFVEVLLWSALLDIRTSASETRSGPLAALQQGLDLAETFDDQRLRLLRLFVGSLVGAAVHDLDRVLHIAAEGRDLALRMGSDLWKARFEIELGIAAQAKGDSGRALEWGRSAIASAPRASDSRTMLMASDLLLQMALGDRGALEALPPPEELLSLARRTRQARVEAAALSVLADQAVHAGHVDEATNHCLAGLALVDSSGLSDTAVRLLSVSICMAETNGDAELGAVVCGHLSSGGAPSAPPILPACDGCRASVDNIRAVLGPRAFELARLRGRSLARDAVWSMVVDFLHGLGSRKERSVTAGDGAPIEPGLLTDRQLEIVRLLACGLTNKEIAQRLGVTAKTVMHHTGAIYSRLGVRGRSEAVAWAARQGLISPDISG